MLAFHILHAPWKEEVLFGTQMPLWLYCLISFGCAVLRVIELVFLYILPALAFNAAGFVLGRDGMLINAPAPWWLLGVGVFALGLRWLQSRLDCYELPESPHYTWWLTPLVETFFGLLMAGLWNGLGSWEVIACALLLESMVLGLAWWKQELPYGWPRPPSGT